MPEKLGDRFAAIATEYKYGLIALVFRINQIQLVGLV